MAIDGAIAERLEGRTHTCWISMTSTQSKVGASPLEESIAAFFASYCQAFEARDPKALSTFFIYPILLTNAEPEQRVLGSPADYTAVIEPLVGLYRELGAKRGKVLDLEVAPLAPSLVVAFIDWEVVGEDDRALYKHRASYTLVRKEPWRIAAIAVNELPKLREALRAKRGAGAQRV